MNPIDPIIKKLDALKMTLAGSTDVTPELVTGAVRDLDDIQVDLETAAIKYDEMAETKSKYVLDALEARGKGASPDGGS